MDLILVIISALFIVVGLFGSVLPILPGPPFSWLGLLILHLTKAVQMSTTLLVVTGVIAIIIFILDYMIPAMGAKKFGGSKSGMIGTTIGLLVGLISPVPGGIIIGPFLGAFIGEMWNHYRTLFGCFYWRNVK